MNGMAFYDQANALIGQGNQEQAQKLLQRPFSGPGSESVKVGLLSLLADSFLRSGKTEQAQQTAQGAIDAYEHLGKSAPDEGLKWQVERAKGIIAQTTTHSR